MRRSRCDDSTPRYRSPIRQPAAISELKNALSAMEKRDRALIAQPEQRKARDSLDLDSAAKRECPNENRWDYLVSVRDVGRIVAIEPHFAKDSEVSVVIRKKEWAERFLQQHFRPGKRVDRWFWVTRGKVGFSRMERATRQLDQAGVAFGGRMLKSLTA